MQKGAGTRLGTELRATRRGWLGDPGDSGSFSLASCALLSPPSGGSAHHWSQVVPSSAPAVPAGIWNLGQVSGWAWGDLGTAQVTLGSPSAPSPQDIPKALSPFLSVPSPKPVNPARSLGNCRKFSPFLARPLSEPLQQLCLSSRSAAMGQEWQNQA